MPKIVDHDAKRKQIIDAMWRLVEREGATAVTVRAVALEAGMSKTSIGHYFSSQGDLLATAVQQAVESVTGTILALDLFSCDVDTVISALDAMIPDTVQRQRQSEVWLLLLSYARSDDAVRKVLHELNSAVRDGIVDVLHAFTNSNNLSVTTDIPELAARLHALIDGLSVQVLTDPPLLSREQARSVLAGAIRDLLEPTLSA